MYPSLLLLRMAGKTPVPEKKKLHCLQLIRQPWSSFEHRYAGTIKPAPLAGGYQTDTPAAIVYKATWNDEKFAIVPLQR